SDAQGALPAALLKGRIGIGVGKYLNGRQPLAVWAGSGEPNSFQSYMYPTEFFVNGVANQPWTQYGDTFTAGGTIETTSFDPREFRRQGGNCVLGDVLSFGLAIAHANGFEVRRGNCARGSFNAFFINWDLVRPQHNLALKEIALRMNAEDDPLIAGTRLLNGS